MVLERATAKGDRLDPAAAFAVGHGRLFTAVAAVDGADRISAVLPDGTRQPIVAVIAMNRQQDWMVLAGGPAGEVDQPVVSDSKIQVGDRLFSIEGAGSGSRVLVDGSLAGRAGSKASGPRLIMTLGGVAPPGEPVFNEFGELVGVIGGSLVPGTSDLSDLLHFRMELRGVPLVPITLIRAPMETPPVPLADLQARGDLLPAVQGGQHVLSGGFALGINRTETVTPADQRTEFSARDKEFVVFVTWSPQARVKGAVALKMYDDANHAVVGRQSEARASRGRMPRHLRRARRTRSGPAPEILRGRRDPPAP